MGISFIFTSVWPQYGIDHGTALAVTCEFLSSMAECRLLILTSRSKSLDYHFKMQNSFKHEQNCFQKDLSGNANHGPQISPLRLRSLCITVMHWSACSLYSKTHSWRTTFTLPQCKYPQWQPKQCTSIWNGNQGMLHGQCRYNLYSTSVQSV